MKASTQETTWIKVPVLGFVTLWKDETETQFRIRYTDAAGRNIRRDLKGVTSLKRAKAVCAEHNEGIALQRHIPSLRERAVKKPSSSLRESLTEATRSMGGNADTRARALQGVNRFLDFLKASYPAVEQWSEIRPSMAVAWIASMSDEDIAWDTMRLAMVPIKYASVYWHEEMGHPDFMATKLVRQKIKTVKKECPRATRAVALTPKQLARLLAWLKENRPLLYPMAVLSGLAGLRMFEAAYLRHCDVDMQAGTITIAKTDLHTPKNRPSYRTIPVHSSILEAIRDHVLDNKVQSLAPELFLHSGGGAWTQSGLFSAWRLTLKEARVACELPAEFKARNLRATFVTQARRAKADYALLQMYIGHTPADVLSGHYDVVQSADLKREVVDAFTDYLKTEIARKDVNKLERTADGPAGPYKSGDK